MCKIDEENKLKELIIENPTLPIVFCCSSDELEDGYLTFYKDFSCDIVTIYEINDEKVFDHIIDVEEYYQDIYESDEDIQKAIEETIQYKAIRVYCK